MSADRMPISRGTAPLADIPDREGGDGGPELVIRGEHPVIAMPVLPRWRHEGSEPVEVLKWGKLDEAAGARPCGLPPASRADPVSRLVSREHVADAGDAAVFAADHGEPLQREGMRGVLANRLRTAELPNFAAQGQSVSRKTGAEVPFTGLSLKIPAGFRNRVDKSTWKMSHHSLNSRNRSS